MVGDTCSSCQCWAWRRHCCSNSAVRHGLGTSAKECLLPVSSARACTDCFESPLCSQASPSNALLHFPPLSLPCSTIAPALHPPAPFCLLSPVKTTAFAEPFTAVLNQSSSSCVLLRIHMLFCPWPQRRSTEPMFGDFSSRHAAFTMMLSPGPALPQ